jgi:RNA recognition motif-containing protein
MRYNNLYVRGFDDKITELDLKHFFSKFGEIKSVRIMRDLSQGNKENAPSLGFGFVCFISRD